jgi:competence protein ComEA
MKTWQSILLGIFLGLLFSGAIFLVTSPHTNQIPILLPTKMADKVMAHVSGAVMKPGVYPLEPNSRVLVAVQAAGGFTQDADQDAVNLAAYVEDEDRIVIPSKNALPLQSPEGQSGAININTADVHELDELPGVGIIKAQAIVDYREKNGFFLTTEDLLKVPGIGPELYQQFKVLVTVNP